MVLTPPYERSRTVEIPNRQKTFTFGICTFHGSHADRHRKRCNMLKRTCPHHPPLQRRLRGHPATPCPGLRSGPERRPHRSVAEETSLALKEGRLVVRSLRDRSLPPPTGAAEAGALSTPRTAEKSKLEQEMEQMLISSNEVLEGGAPHA